jgi:hypothetical protein
MIMRSGTWWLLAGAILMASCAADRSDVITHLENYATLLREMKRDAQASVIEERAQKLREARSSTSGSVYLGFSPSGSLRGYSALLRERGRDAEAKDIENLADQYDREQVENFIRWQQIHQQRSY